MANGILEKYLREIRKPKNLKFGVAWGFLAVLLGVFIIQIIDILTRLTSYLILGLRWIVGLPVEAQSFLNIPSPANYVVALIIAIAVAPFARRIVEFIFRALKKNPL